MSAFRGVRCGSICQGLGRRLANDIGDWVVKGFIDTYQNIYTISADTKVISKLIELMLFPLFSQFAGHYGYELHLAEHQNYYPDMTFIAIPMEIKVAC